MDYGLPLSCQHCGTVNDPRTSSTGILACASCGLTSVEGAFSMQDDLSKMFERGMTFSQPVQQAPAPIDPQPSGLGYSASQHYIPVTRPAIDIDSTALTLELQSLLLRNNIDPATLLPAQRALFENASAEQRERLLMLWSISSPAQTRSAGISQNGTTSMENEEALARLSFEKRHSMPQGDAAEPYIQAGYGLNDEPASEYRQAVDPVYQSKEWWRHEPVPRQPQEFQYGTYEVMRQYHVPIGEDEMMS